ncbi:MAG: thioredoxin [Christensenellales bacterium]|jgi:thioredoxin 1|nr:thioredoxin [Clostridiales bacterium]
MKEINGRDELVNVVQNNSVVLVDFFASWCGPCRMLTPTLEKLASDYEDKAVIAKIDIEKNRDLAIEFEVSAVPTLALFKNGSLVNKFSGMRSYADLSKMIDDNI